MRGSQHPPRIRGDFSLHLLTQIEILRGDISHEQLSKRLGDVTGRYLARYVAGKVHLLERDFYQLAKALSICPRVLAEQWAIAHVACECRNTYLTKTRWGGSGNERTATGGNTPGLRGFQPIEFPLTLLL